jgi:hypothetical protein
MTTGTTTKGDGSLTLRSDRWKQIAVVTFSGVLPLELIGTVSALDGLGLNTGFRPVTVAVRRDLLETKPSLPLEGARRRSQEDDRPDRQSCEAAPRHVRARRHGTAQRFS